MDDSLPISHVEPRARSTWIWLVPLSALALGAWLAYQGWAGRGLTVVLQFREGHGLAVGDELRHRGIAVGTVESIRLLPRDRGITIDARLTSEADFLAVSGTRFWIVHPRIDLTGIAGVDTIVGSRYIEVDPGAGAARTRFLGLESAPPVLDRDPGDLEVVLESPSRAGLRVGTPVLYRRVKIGTTLSVGLASDGRSVESRLLVRKAYVHLLRPETMFWSVGGFETRIGIHGLSAEFDSLETLLVGGISIATPPDAGDVVRQGHRFRLQDEPDDDWAEWNPSVVLGDQLLPAGAALPHPVRAALAWKESRFIVFSSDRSRSGWLLPTERGLLGPFDLLRPSDDEDEELTLEIGGKAYQTTDSTLDEEDGLAWFDATLADTPTWPLSRLRRPTEPEDFVLVSDPAATHIPIAAARLTFNANRTGWTLDETISLDTTHHGAVAVARSDGSVLGVALVNDEGAEIRFVPETQR